MTQATQKQFFMMVGAGVVTALVVSWINRNFLIPPVAKNDDTHGAGLAWTG